MSSNSNACQQPCLKLLAENQKNRPIGKVFESHTKGENSTGCWNFLQALKNTSYDFKQIINETEHVYVNPLTKRSTYSLSTQSLEMCTETLGSETGSSIDPNLDEYSHLVLEKQSSNRIKQQKTREFCKKIKYSSSFPPPLSSISGSNGVKVEAHREGGRLVITAFSFSASRIYFKAERENGRLRLFLVEDELAEKREEDGEKLGRKRGGEELCSSRCNGDGSGSKKIPSLPLCVAFS